LVCPFVPAALSVSVSCAFILLFDAHMFRRYTWLCLDPVVLSVFCTLLALQSAVSDINIVTHGFWIDVCVLRLLPSLYFPMLLHLD
jgi:hypothetical protein